jgi:hypothetical protein
MRTESRGPLFVILASAALSVGCATFDNFDLPWSQRVPEASRSNPVVRILCLWEPSEGRDPNGMTCRGFAGQVLFLGNRGGSPVKVNGDVRVYEFDDLGTPDEQTAPLHEFEFQGAAWERHMKVGSFGPAYHVFIPYMRPGTHEANCAVRIRYKPNQGEPIFSDMTNIFLKGTPREKRVKSSPALSPPIDPLPVPARQVRSTTIPLDAQQDFSTIAAPNDAHAQQLLQDFLRTQPPEIATPQIDPVDEPSAPSPRIRWDGQRAEVVPRDAEAADPLEAQY